MHVDESRALPFCCCLVCIKSHFGDESWWNDLCCPSCRCVTCTQCGATSPGLRCEWQKNYTQCAPCASLATCPICLVDYSEGTTILQCRQCDRSAAFLQTLVHVQVRVFVHTGVLFPSSDGSMHRARVFTQRKMWKKPRKMASTAQCVEPLRLLKVWGQLFSN